MDDIARLKETVVTAARILDNEALAQGFGHISVRIPGTDQFLIQGNVSPGLVTVEDILTINLQGEKLSGQLAPVGETWIHTCIFRARPDVNSVSHVHPPYTIAVSATGARIRPLHHFGAFFPTGVDTYMPVGLVNTESLGIAVAEMLEGLNALVLRGHGAVVVGEDIVSACLASIYLEEAARTQFRALQIGDPIYFTEAEATMVGNQLRYRPFMERAWNYYKARLLSLHMEALPGNENPLELV